MMYFLFVIFVVHPTATLAHSNYGGGKIKDKEEEAEKQEKGN